VILPEELQQVRIGDVAGVIVDLEGLGVISELLVRRIRLRAAGVADAGPDDSR
jgi:hypothetical protein